MDKNSKLRELIFVLEMMLDDLITTTEKLESTIAVAYQKVIHQEHMKDIFELEKTKETVKEEKQFENSDLSAQVEMGLEPKIEEAIKLLQSVKLNLIPTTS